MPTRRLVVRLALLAAVLGTVAAAVFGHHRDLWVEIGVAALLGVGLGDLFTLGLERFVGLRYLHRGRRSRGARVALIAGLALAAAGFVAFAAARGHSRAFETAAVVIVLIGALSAVVAFLLRTFSVFT